MSRFTVLGATGNTGAVVAHALLDAGHQIRVLARHPDKVAALAGRGAEVAVGDVLDPAAVSAALAGADGAYLLVPPDPTSIDLVGRGRRIVEHYARGLAEHRVRHAVLLSSVGAQVPRGTGPIVITHEAERRLAQVAGTAFTFVRAAYFMENLLGFAHPMKQDGVLPVFGGGEEIRFPMVATRDIGEVAAAALLAPPASTEVVELAGPTELSFADAAREAAAILGRPVVATAVPIDAMVPTLTSFGLSAEVAGLYREMTEALGRGLVRFEGRGRSVRGKVGVAEVLRPALA